MERHFDICCVFFFLPTNNQCCYPQDNTASIIVAIDPDYGREAVLIPALKAMLEEGSVVSYKCKGYDESAGKRIARIIDYNYDAVRKKQL